MKFKKVIVLFLFFFSANLFPQKSFIMQDSIPRHTLTTVVITADKFENQLLSSTSAVNLINENKIESYAVSDFADLMKLIPGTFVFSRDGLGKDPIVGARGYYGGGEAEYLTVLVDGVVINDVESGLVNWNFIPLMGIEKVEVVSGGASALYGDAAIGGVINILTNKSGSLQNSLSISGGSFGTFNAGIMRRGSFGKNNYHLYLTNEQTNGFRNHSKWRGTSFGGNLSLPLSSSTILKFISNNQLLVSDEPGPLTELQLNSDRTSSSVLYKADGKDEQRFNFQSDLLNKLTDNSDLSFSLIFQNKSANNVRTFSNTAPIVDPQTFQPVGVYDTSLYADTKEREFSVNDFGFRAKYYNNFSKINNRILIGIEGNYADYSNKYYNFFNGFEEDYSNGNPSRGSLSIDGKGTRFKYAAYLNNEIKVTDFLKFVVGLRYDFIKDELNNSLPDSTIQTDNSAFSPKAGINFNFANSEKYKGSIYLNYNRSFKAPTIDQQADLKPLDFAVFFPVGENQFMIFPSIFPPFANAELKPQLSDNFEIGTYQIVEIFDNFFTEISLTAYQTDIKDEIDFDLNTFTYRNIQNSRHRGIEGSINFNLMNNWNAFVNYTYSEVKFRSGQYTGNFLKAIPQNVFGAGLAFSNAEGFNSAVYFNNMNDIYLDDENKVNLPSFNFVNIRLSYKINIFNFIVDVENVFDEEYSTTGFLLGEEKYLYPAAGRTIFGGVEINF